MTGSDDLYAFVYRGLLAGVAIDKAQAPTSAPADPKLDESDVQRRIPLDILDDSLVLAARKMAWVYTGIAAFENSVRVFVERRLTEKVGPDWWEKAVSSQIKRDADRKKTEEELIRWHGVRGSGPLAYVQLDDLAVIIQNNFDHFKDLVTTVEWVREVFRSLTKSRNVIMHSGQLTVNDIERVAMNIRDWTRQVGE